MHNKTLTLAAAQFSPSKGNVLSNLTTIAEIIQKASEEKADLILFPEACVTGYFLEGGVEDHALVPTDLVATLAGLLAHLERPIDVCLGFYESSDDGVFNSALYAEFNASSSRLVKVYRKFFLPTYGVFDEERFVGSGRELGVFDTRFGRIGILICEDVWHTIYSTLHVLAGAQLVLVPSASPARGLDSSEPENVQKYRSLLTALSAEHGIYSACSLLCGFEGGKGLSGGSFIVEPEGQIIASAPLLEKAITVAEVDFADVERYRSRTPLYQDLKQSWQALKGLANRIDL